jgi:hypothetical protein
LKKAFILLFILSLGRFSSYAQFAPAAGITGTDAINKDSSIIKFWCDSMVIQKGRIQINDTALGFPSIGDASSAYGKALENGIVSLGDGGIATAYFKEGVFDEEGPDFAIFENGFEVPGTGTYHMELAFVEVSTDGKKFYRFPAQSLNDTTIQIDNFTGMYPEKVRNLAGKHVTAFGVPFDIEEMVDSLQHQTIHYIRIIDVVGSLNDSLASRDAFGRKINDPFPTPYPSSGFDLDAIGIIHGQNSNAIKELNQHTFKLYPNPKLESESITIENTEKEIFIQCYDSNGKLIQELKSNEPSISLKLETTSKLIFVRITSNNSISTFKIQQW